jgi:sulfite reductase alpha subunit
MSSEQKMDQSVTDEDMAMLEKLEKGPWPSHVTELKKTKYPIEYYAWGVAHKYSPWYSGSFRVKYVFSGILARRSRDGKVSETHRRTYSPAGRFLSTSYLRKLVEVADNYGIGLMEFGGNTGSIVINIQSEKADQAIDAIRSIIGSDVGGSGDTFREFYACPGPAICEYALYDTLQAMDYFRSHPQIYKYLNTQMFPYKLKFKFSGCPLDCATANSRSDFSFVGTWVGAPDVDQAKLRYMVESGKVNPKELVEGCPSCAITWDEEKKEVNIDGAKCLKAMNCIKKAFPAIKPGKERKIALLVGSHAQAHYGPRLSWGVALLDDYDEALPFILKTIDTYVDNAPRRHRLADLILRKGFRIISDIAQQTLPDKPKATPSSHLRLTTGAVLSDDERQEYDNWAKSLVKEYGGE